MILFDFLSIFFRFSARDLCLASQCLKCTSSSDIALRFNFTLLKLGCLYKCKHIVSGILDGGHCACYGHNFHFFSFFNVQKPLWRYEQANLCNVGDVRRHLCPDRYGGFCIYPSTYLLQ